MFDFIGIISQWDLFHYLFGAITILGIMYLLKNILLNR